MQEESQEVIDFIIKTVDEQIKYLYKILEEAARLRYFRLN